MSQTASATVSATLPARLAANRSNAQKSTGPRTTEGKAAIANNALKHGLRSQRNPLDLANDTCLPFECEDFEATLEAFTADLAPATPFEIRLVERLAQIDLRLQRTVRMETAHLDISARRVHLASANALPDDPSARNGWLTTLAFLHDPSSLKLLGQYESRLTRDFARTLTQLRQAQKLRNQTQTTEPLKEHSATHSGTIPTQSHPSDGVVAFATIETAISAPGRSVSVPEMAKQTQSHSQPPSANDTAASPVSSPQ